MIVLLIFLLHCFATFGLAGVALYQQIVGYPLLRKIPDEAFQDYLHEGLRKTAWIVGPGIVVELATGIILLTLPNWRESIFSLNVLLLLGGILSSVLLRVPLQRKLKSGKDEEAIRRVIMTSWISTSAYIGRCIILILVSLPNA